MIRKNKSYDGEEYSDVTAIVITIQGGQEPSKRTPDFELVFALYAIGVAMFLWRKKRSI